MSLYLDTPVQYIKGVGPKLGELLGRKGIYTVADLIHFFPRAYEDRRAARNIASLKPDEIVSLRAQLMSISSHPLGQSRRRVYDLLLKDQSGMIRCKYFRVPFRGYFDRFKTGESVRVIGKVSYYRGRLEFHHPDIKLEEDAEDLKDCLIPLYSETERLSTRKISSVMDTTFQSGLNIPEYLPDWLRAQYDLLSREEAIRCLHFPPPNADAEFLEGRSLAHRRLIFEEFFWLELVLLLRRKQIKKKEAFPIPKSERSLHQLLQSLPFTLTQGQKAAFDEIAQDMEKDHPMLRLLQGDVGSGKTLVAFMALCQAAEAGYQGAMMAPTEILSFQHFQSAKKWLEPLGFRLGFLAGSTKTKERNNVLSQLKSGELQLLFGTHALIQDDVEYANLGVAVIDEQHRFGVEQREQLQRKGRSPHFLIMTATPIPRTLAMTAYGDLDVSTINERPAGRSPIISRMTYESKRGQVLGFVIEQIKSGRQAYVVLPLVEESEHMDLKNAQEEFERLKLELASFQVGLLHGRQGAEEKDKVMASFRSGELSVLVSTTVIEVGVDVPNANIIWIQNAERFGLSQLHQLRGRVGRGTHKSYCVLMMGKASSQEARERVSVLEATLDGFKIAEKDLELRGPGEILGTKQSGLPEFHVANLLRDTELLKEARDAVHELILKDATFSQKEHQALKTEWERRQQAFRYLTVG